MKLKEYLSETSLFGRMGVSQLNDIAPDLDALLKSKYGERTCGSIISTNINVSGTVVPYMYDTIARQVYLLNKNKWDSLIAFADEEMSDDFDIKTVTTSQYGKKVTSELGGENSINGVDKIAGFNSSDLVDSQSNDKVTKFGKTDSKEFDGQDVKTVEKRSNQKEVLVDYKLQFWERYGLVRTLLADAVKCLCLPLYDLESEDN